MNDHPALNPQSAIRHPQSKFLVGPVLSRRIGRSLGVDILQGQCTFMCPYCEVRVRHVDRLRLFEFENPRELYEEYRRFCETHAASDLDSVTFSGTGEPTLISNLGEILRKFKTIGPYPLTVITNGSLLSMPRVRRNLRHADLVVPSLDAVTESAWRRVNRPHPDMTLEKYLDGTLRFCAGHPGKIWMEVLLVRGVNDRPEDIDALGLFLKRLRLNRVQVGTVDRPPAKTRARPLLPAKMADIARRIADLSGQRVQLMARAAPAGSASPAPQVPASPAPAAQPNRLDEEAAVAEKIIRSATLRPQTPRELQRLLAVPAAVFDRTVRGLEASGEISRVRFGRRIFLKA